MLGDWLQRQTSNPGEPGNWPSGGRSIWFLRSQKPVLSPAEPRLTPRELRDMGRLAGLRDQALVSVISLQLRAGERGDRDAAAGLLPAGAPGVAQAQREGRHASLRPGRTHQARPRRSSATSRGDRALARRRSALSQWVDPAGRRLSGRAHSRFLVNCPMIVRHAVPARGCAALDLLPHVPGDRRITAYLSNGRRAGRTGGADRRPPRPRGRRSSTTGRRTRWAPSTMIGRHRDVELAVRRSRSLPARGSPVTVVSRTGRDRHLSAVCERPCSCGEDARFGLPSSGIVDQTMGAGGARPHRNPGRSS